MRAWEMLPTPHWLKAAERENEVNDALNLDYPARLRLLYELVLDGSVDKRAYNEALPTYDEIAQMCTQSLMMRDTMSTYQSWQAELFGLTDAQIAYIYGVITGNAVAVNDMTLEHVCAKLASPQPHEGAIIHAHFKRVQRGWDDEFEVRTRKFTELLGAAEVIVRSLTYSHFFVGEGPMWSVEYEDDEVYGDGEDQLIFSRDLRLNSDTFSLWSGVKLNANNNSQLLSLIHI